MKRAVRQPSANVEVANLRDGMLVDSPDSKDGNKEFYERLFREEVAQSIGCDLTGSSGREIALPSLPIDLLLAVDRIRANSRLAHGWAIKRSGLEPATVKSLEKFLTVGGDETGFGGLPAPTYPLFRRMGDELVIPRTFGVLQFRMTPGMDMKALCKGENCDPERMRFSPEFKLKEDYPPQVTATQEVIRRWKREGSAILSLPCGMGKTACAIWLSTEGTRQLWGSPGKTVVLVATEKLLHQWAKSYDRFAPTLRVKLIQGPRLDYHDCDVCIAMVQTVMGHLETDPSDGPWRRSTDSTAPNSWGFWSEFALVVVDETHHVAARRFSQVVTSFNSKLTLGLSATPEGRADKKHHVVAWLVGQIAFRMRRDPSRDNLLIHMVYLDVDIPDFPKDPKLETVWSMSKAQDAIANCWQRNAILARILVRLARQGRMIFALADRRCQICPDEASAACVTSLVSRVDLEVGKTCALLVGQMPVEAQDAALEKPVVLATFPMAEEALDDPKRDTLVLLTSKTNRRCLEQSIGRIVRIHERKKTIRPMLIDIVDKQEALAGRGRVRARVYEQIFGYKCEHHNWSDIESKFPPMGPPLSKADSDALPKTATKRRRATADENPDKAPLPQKRQPAKTPKPKVAARPKKKTKPDSPDAMDTSL